MNRSQINRDVLAENIAGLPVRGKHQKVLVFACHVLHGHVEPHGKHQNHTP